MFFLVVAQLSRHKFCSNASHVQIVRQNALNGPVRQSYNLTNIIESSPTICNESLTHFCDVLRWCACRRSSRTLIVVDRRSSVLEAFVPQKSFALAHSIISKRFLKHSVGSAAVCLSLKQNLMQILCSLKSAISVGEKNCRTTKTRRYRNARNSRTRPLRLPAVGTLIHKGYCSAHVAAAGRRVINLFMVKFPELLNSTSYTIW
jgi:hypothetical protein